MNRKLSNGKQIYTYKQHEIHPIFMGRWNIYYMGAIYVDRNTLRECREWIDKHNEEISK